MLGLGGEGDPAVGGWVGFGGVGTGWIEECDEIFPFTKFQEERHGGWP